jgi:hypothetical protein
MADIVYFASERTFELRLSSNGKYRITNPGLTPSPSRRARIRHAF